MKGHTFLKITGILMIVSSVLSIFLGVVVAGFTLVVAGLGAAGALTADHYLVLIVKLAGGICQLIAGIKGVKHSKSSENSKKLIVWGAVVVVFSILTIVMTLVSGGEISVPGILTGLAVPGLYIYGAVLNSKADDTQYAA